MQHTPTHSKTQSTPTLPLPTILVKSDGVQTFMLPTLNVCAEPAQPCPAGLWWLKHIHPLRWFWSMGYGMTHSGKHMEESHVWNGTHFWKERARWKVQRPGKVILNLLRLAYGWSLCLWIKACSPWSYSFWEMQTYKQGENQCFLLVSFK